MDKNVFNLNRREAKLKIMQNMGFRKATEDERAALTMEKELYVLEDTAGQFFTFEGGYEAARIMRTYEDE